MQGYDSNTFILNTGSYFLLFAAIIAFYFIRWILNSLMRLCPKYKCARQIGIWSYEKSYTRCAWDGIVKLFIESYFLLSLCVAL